MVFQFQECWNNSDDDSVTNDGDLALYRQRAVTKAGFVSTSNLKKSTIMPLWKFSITLSCIDGNECHRRELV